MAWLVFLLLFLLPDREGPQPKRTLYDPPEREPVLENYADKVVFVIQICLLVLVDCAALVVFVPTPDILHVPSRCDGVSPEARLLQQEAICRLISAFTLEHNLVRPCPSHYTVQPYQGVYLGGTARLQPKSGSPMAQFSLN